MRLFSAKATLRHLHLINKVSYSILQPPRSKQRQFNLHKGCENEKMTFFQAKSSGFSLWYLVACLAAFKKQNQRQHSMNWGIWSERKTKYKKQRGKSLFKFNLTLSFRFILASKTRLQSANFGNENNKLGEKIRTNFKFQISFSVSVSPW